MLLHNCSNIVRSRKAYITDIITDRDVASGITEGLWRIAVDFIRNPNPRPTLRIFGEHVPGVDLLIVCCGEPRDIVLDTVKAACQIDYPVNKLRIILADDAHDPILRNEVLELHETHPNLHYHARIKPDEGPHGYKAGNINTTMKYVDTLPGGQHEFIGVLDADMIPEPCILRALIPHAVIDEKVGMVTTAQVGCPLQMNVMKC